VRRQYCTLILCTVELIVNCYSLDSKTGVAGSTPAGEHGSGAAGATWRRHCSPNSSLLLRISRVWAGAGFVVRDSLIDNLKPPILSLARVVGTNDHMSLGGGFVWVHNSLLLGQR